MNFSSSGRADGSLDIVSLNSSLLESASVDTPADGGPVKSVAFNANCTGMATAHASGAVCIWSLKGEPSIIQRITGISKVTKLRFDKSGKWLLICSQALNVYYCENKDSGYELRRTFTDHREMVSDAAFGGENVFVSVSMDRDMRIYGGE